MRFIKVIATPCDGNGQSLRGGIPSKTFKLNIDLIGGIDNDTIMLKGGEIIRLGSNWFKEFRLSNQSDMNNL